MNIERLKSFLSHPLVALLGLVVAPVGLYEWGQRAHQQNAAALAEPGWSDVNAASDAGARETPKYDMKYVNAPGVQPREFHSPAGRGFLAEEEVIGVVVNGRARAYLLEAVRPLKESVVNDVVAGHPISIIYAADADVVRVLTPRSSRRDSEDAASSSPCDLSIVGSMEGQLYLAGYGQEFFFDARNIPLVDYPYARCPWRAVSLARLAAGLSRNRPLRGQHPIGRRVRR